MEVNASAGGVDHQEKVIGNLVSIMLILLCFSCPDKLFMFTGQASF